MTENTINNTESTVSVETNGKPATFVVSLWTFAAMIIVGNAVCETFRRGKDVVTKIKASRAEKE